MRVSPKHLVADALCNIVKIEDALLLGHLRMKYHLKQQVAQFVAQRIKIIACNRVRDFVERFLDYHLEARPRSHREFLAVPNRNSPGSIPEECH